MKKFSTFLIMMIFGLACFGGCSSKKAVDKLFTEENLALNAATTASNTEKGKKDKGVTLVDKSKSSVWKKDGLGRGYVDIDFGKEVTFNTVVLQEKTDAVVKFRLYKQVGEKWQMIYEQDRIMTQRICYIEETTASKIRFEILESLGDVEIKSLEVYNVAKQQKDFRVVDYMTMGGNEMEEKQNDEGFTGYFNVVDEVVIIGSVRLDSEANVIFDYDKEIYPDTEAQFAKSLNILEDIIAKSGRDIKIWATIFFNQYDSEGKNSHDLVRDFVHNKIDTINANVKAFVEKYNLHGIDYDWEYPSTASQWKAYDKIVIETSKYTNVSVALPPWGVKFSKEAINAMVSTNIMTYDIFDSRGDHSNIFAGTIQAIDYFEKLGFSKKQILIGLPTYGRSANKSGGAWPIFTDELGKWGNIYYDYKYNDDNSLVDGETLSCKSYMNGYAMFRDKTATAIAMDIGGIMVFRMKCDAPYTSEYSLHKAIGEVVANRLN